MSERKMTSGEIRKRYFKDVIEPEPEDVHARMKDSFDTGVTAGMYASLEWAYIHLDEYGQMTITAIDKIKTEGGDESDSTQT